MNGWLQPGCARIIARAKSKGEKYGGKEIVGISLLTPQHGVRHIHTSIMAHCWLSTLTIGFRLLNIIFWFGFKNEFDEIVPWQVMNCFFIKAERITWIQTNSQNIRLLQSSDHQIKQNLYGWYFLYFVYSKFKSVLDTIKVEAKVNQVSLRWDRSSNKSSLQNNYVHP